VHLTWRLLLACFSGYSQHVYIISFNSLMSPPIWVSSIDLQCISRIFLILFISNPHIWTSMIIQWKLQWLLIWILIFISCTCQLDHGSCWFNCIDVWLIVNEKPLLFFVFWSFVCFIYLIFGVSSPMSGLQHPLWHPHKFWGVSPHIPTSPKFGGTMFGTMSKMHKIVLTFQFSTMDLQTI